MNTGNFDPGLLSVAGVAFIGIVILSVVAWVMRGRRRAAELERARAVERTRQGMADRFEMRKTEMAQKLESWKAEKAAHERM